MGRPRPAAKAATEGEERPSHAEVEQRLREHRATPLGECGEEPDPRFTFANERTFLAWSRTALALIAAGLGAAQLLHFSFGGVRLIIALPLIVRTMWLSAVRRSYAAHRRIAVWTFPVWAYVSVTGVIVYWILYRL